MAISSEQLHSDIDLERFWCDPFGHARLDYASRPAHDLTDFVGFCFNLSYTIPHGCVDDEGVPNISDSHTYAIRAQFIATLRAYVDSLADGEGPPESGEPTVIGADQLSVVWSVAAVRADEVVFWLAVSGLEACECKARLDTGLLTIEKVDQFEHMNNLTYAVIKCWRLGEWCRNTGLPEVAHILDVVIDAVGDPHGDVGLLAQQVGLFRTIQGSARGSALTRALSERS